MAIFHSEPTAPCCHRFRGFRGPPSTGDYPPDCRSGIRSEPRPFLSKKHVVSVHLNHANSGEWELWTDEKYTKTGAWPVGGVAMCDLESNSSIRNRVPSTGSISMFLGALSMPLRTMQDCVRSKRLHCVYGTPDPVLHHLTQAILPCLNRPEMFSQLFIDSFTMTVCSHLVVRYSQLHFPTRPATQGRSGPWQMRRALELLQRASGRRVKAGNACRGMPWLSASHFARSFKEDVQDLPTSVPDSAARGDREGPFGRNEQLAGGNCGAGRIF